MTLIIQCNGDETMTTAETIQGVYYRTEDYAGLIRRVLIALVDAAVIFACWMLLSTVWWFVFEEESTFMQASLITLPLLAYLYLSLIKRMWGTLGYWTTGVRIVDMFGQRPSIVRMTGRFLWLTFHPISIFLDLIWLTGEETRQTLRDKMVGTYVIRKQAQPIGTGDYGIKILSLGGLCLRVREVKVSPPQSSEVDGDSTV